MNLTVVYLIQRFFYRIIEFLRHWYVKSMRMYWNFVFNKLEDIDYYLAWKVTFKHLFEPLYKDYSLVGYVLGFCFRSLRLLVASAVYALIFAFTIACYILWIFIPPYLLLRIIQDLIL